MLKINNLTFSYHRSGPRVLDGFSLSMERGKIYGLLGPNGAGKTTLLYLIAGMLTPQGGCALFDGQDTRRRLPSVMEEIFIVPDEIWLPAMPLSRFVKANAPFYPRFSHENMERYLGIFGMKGDMNLGQLSMGQRKKVFMSFALATGVSLLLMDEPTNALDIPGKEAFRKFIAEGMSDDRSIIISTHQVWDVDRLLDHVIIMDGSQVALDSSIARIMSLLKFSTVADREAARQALYSRPMAGGTDIITINDDGSETAPDLEMLFNFATQRPDEIKNIINKKQ